MGERAKVILNEYSAKNLLMRDTLDLDKFYTADLKLFVEVARKEIERLNNIINELEKYINVVTDDDLECVKKLQQENKKYKEVIDKLEKKIKVVKQYDFDKVGRYELLNILKGSDSNVKD